MPTAVVPVGSDEGDGTVSVMIGIDPHKGSHTAAAIDLAENELGQLRVRAATGQVERLLTWAEEWPERIWAVENAGGLGYLLSQQLLAAGERVLDVPPKLAARVRLLATGDINKNDPNDALSVAVAALRSPAVKPVAAENHQAVMKLGAKRHRDLGRARTQLVCRLHAVLCDLVPGGGISKELSGRFHRTGLECIRNVRRHQLRVWSWGVPGPGRGKHEWLRPRSRRRPCPATACSRRNDRPANYRHSSHRRSLRRLQRWAVPVCRARNTRHLGASRVQPADPGAHPGYRDGTGGITGPLTAGQTVNLTVGGMNGVPTQASAVVMNATIAEPTAASFLTIWPQGVTRALASNLNWTPGQIVPNLVTVKLGTGGGISIFNNVGDVQVILHLAGFYS